jgi:hypothetical protein
MSDTALGCQTHPLRALAETAVVPGQPRASWVALVAFAVVLGGCAAHGPAAPGPHVVWVHGDHAYVASRDSLALATGDSLSFALGGRSIARGIVRSVGQGEMAAVAIASGSLAGVKDLGRLGVTAIPRRPGRPTLLRIAYPSAKRSTLLFSCARVDIQSPEPYLLAVTSQRSMQLVRRESEPSRERLGPYSLWPETLSVRLFDEASDEEIALERGELDVGVFWPGELSGHMREHPRWGAFLVGVASGRLALTAGAGDTLATADARVFTTLNRDLFRGDLVLLLGGERAPEMSPPASGEVGGVRFLVDRAIPGHVELQRALDRLAALRPTTDAPAESARVVYQDTRPSDPPLGAADAPVVPLFAVGCPVVCAPDLRAYLKAMDLDRIVNLLQCRPADRRP